MMRAGMGDATNIARLRKLCMSFPEANERISHGEPTWFAGKGKVFAMLDNHHHGSKHLAVWLPQPYGVQEALIAKNPKRFFKPPYMGPSGWVAVVLDGKTPWKLLEQLMRDGYALIASAKLKKALADR